MPSKIQQSETQKIPKLRFPGFSGGWEEKRLGDIFSFRSTNSFSRENLNYKSGEVKNIHYGDIHTKFGPHFDITKEVVPFVNNEIKLNKILSDNYCKEGDVIIADASEDYSDIGKSIEIINLNNEKVLAGLHTLQARPETNLFFSGFSAYLMKSQKVHAQIMTIAQGTKVLSISTGRLANIFLNFPSLLEQQKITGFLGDVDGWIQNLQAQKESFESYKKGLMQKVFSQKTRFKDDKGNEFPKWEQKKLGEVANFRRGSFPQPYGLRKWYDDENGFPFVQVYDVDDNFKLKNSTKRRITSAAKKLSVFVEKGTIVLTIQGSIGRIALTQYDACVDRTLLIFKSFKKPVNKLFFMHIIFLLFEIEKMKAPGGTIKTITKEVLSNFKIWVPCLQEQEKIAEFLTSVDNIIESKHQQITQAEQWKKGLMQGLFI